MRTDRSWQATATRAVAGWCARWVTGLPTARRECCRRWAKSQVHSSPPRDTLTSRRLQESRDRPVTVEVWALSGGVPLAAGLGVGLQQPGQHNCKHHLPPPVQLAWASQEHAAVAQLGQPPWHACSSVMPPSSMHEITKVGTCCMSRVWACHHVRVQDCLPESSTAICPAAHLQKAPRCSPDCMLYRSILPLSLPTMPKLPQQLMATALTGASGA